MKARTSDPPGHGEATASNEGGALTRPGTGAAAPGSSRSLCLSAKMLSKLINICLIEEPNGKKRASLCVLKAF